MDAIDITPLGLFMQAGPVGKAVMATLLGASVWCWILILVIIVSIIRLRSAIARARAHRESRLIAPVLAAGLAARSLDLPGETVTETRYRLQEAMQREARTLLHAVEGGLPNLAVISSVAPFVGLFGTVWGIMTSFAGIAAAKDTSLAVVAPGIAEALATTAIGLVAAIPASIAYSRLGASLGATAGELNNVIEERAVALMVRQPTTFREVA